MKTLRYLVSQFNLERSLTAFQNLWRGLGRLFAPVAASQPKTGLRPLTSDIYRPSRRHRMAW